MKRDEREAMRALWTDRLGHQPTRAEGVSLLDALDVADAILSGKGRYINTLRKRIAELEVERDRLRAATARLPLADGGTR